MESDENSYRLLYDGQCPMCQAFAHIAEVDAAGTALEKIDARKPSALKDEATAAKLDLDTGIVIKHAGKLYYGWQALHLLATNAKGVPLRTRLLFLPFHSQALARILGGALVKCRRLLLWLLRRPLIRNIS